MTKPIKDKPPIAVAVLPNLVDIVRKDAKPDSPRFFLFQNGTTEWNIVRKDEPTLLPAREADMGWLPPRLGAVKGAHSGLLKGSLKTEVLFRQVRNKLESFCHLPDPNLYDVLAAWVFHTYRMDWWERTPIVMLYGDADTGKNQVGETLAYLSYRGENHGMLTTANVFRSAQLLESTLFFDVARFNLALRKDGMEEVVIKRTQQGSMVRRITDPSLATLAGQRTFRPWGATAVATNEIPASDPILSRCLFIASEAVDTPYDIPTAIGLGGLQEQLVAWRWMTMEQDIKPDPKVQGQGTKRWRQITRPILQLTELVAPSRLAVVKQGLNYFQAAQKRVRSQGDIADVVGAVMDTIALNRHTLDRIATEDLLTSYRAITGDTHASIKAINQRLHSLGLKSGVKLDGGNKRGWRYDPGTLNRKVKDLGLED